MRACGSCKACCTNAGDRVPLRPDKGDVIADYDAQPTVNPVTRGLAFQLKRKPTGECVYVTDAGCGIYERRPWVCRQYHCVDQMTRHGDKARGRMPADVYAAAIARLQDVSA